jgi:hypothetical protein
VEGVSAVPSWAPLQFWRWCRYFFSFFFAVVLMGNDRSEAARSHCEPTAERPFTLCACEGRRPYRSSTGHTTHADSVSLQVMALEGRQVVSLRHAQGSFGRFAASSNFQCAVAFADHRGLGALCGIRIPQPWFCWAVILCPRPWFSGTQAAVSAQCQVFRGVRTGARAPAAHAAASQSTKRCTGHRFQIPRHACIHRTQDKRMDCVTSDVA